MNKNYLDLLKNQDQSKPKFTILLPPPNITGILHIGHFFNWSVQDSLLRYKYTKGYCVDWKIGIDHAGISAQFVVERELRKKNQTKETLGKKKFVDHIWEWKNIAENLIFQQAKEFDLLMNWNNLKFTMNEDYQLLVKQSFKKLFEAGLIYKQKKLTNWDVEFQTAISDLEVKEIEETKILYIIEYKNEDPTKDSIKIATTRPETMFADAAIAVHSNNSQYQHLKNNKFLIPILNTPIPLIFDDAVSETKGTGALKVDPAHDLLDYTLGIKYNLQIKEIISKEGKIFNTNTSLDGLLVLEARKKILEMLKNANVLVEEQQHKGVSKIGEKSNKPIEYLLTDQWFLNMNDMAKKALDKIDEINFFPSHLKNTYKQWLTNIEPWCISRQIWWGHEIPIFYTKDKKAICALTLEEAKEIAKEDVVQETDVLDTWFSSALWPIYNNSMQTSEILITGKDILFFWVARMVMFSLYFEDTLPFKNVFLHGIIRDNAGQKMSKTTQNTLNPIDINEIYGKDALRFSLFNKCNSNKEKDIKISTKEIEISRNFITKIENIHKFIFNFLNKDFNENQQLDNWMETQLFESKEIIENALETYNFQQASNELTDLIYNKFANFYVEGMKIYPSEKIYNFWFIILSLAHPLIPFITQELYSSITNKNVLDHKFVLEKKENNFSNIIKITKLLRNLKHFTSINDFFIDKDQDLVKHFAQLKLNCEQDYELKIFGYNLYLLSHVISDFKAVLEKQIEETNETVEKILKLCTTFNSQTNPDVIEQTNKSLNENLHHKQELIALHEIMNSSLQVKKDELKEK